MIILNVVYSSISDNNIFYKGIKIFLAALIS